MKTVLICHDVGPKGRLRRRIQREVKRPGAIEK